MWLSDVKASSDTDSQNRTGSNMNIFSSKGFTQSEVKPYASYADAKGYHVCINETPWVLTTDMVLTHDQ